MRKLCFIFLVGITLFFTPQGYSVEHEVKDGPGADHFFWLFNYPLMINQWEFSRNPAAQLFYDSGRISRVHSKVGVEQNSLRAAMDPGEIQGVRLQTESMRPIGNARVRGAFGYQNHRYDDLMFNGNMDFSGRNIYMLGDTLGGKQRQEGYHFLAELAYPFFNERLYTGIRMDYESRVGAKMQDLRNRNTISRAKITPGLIYHHGTFSAGLSGGPVIENNYTDVRAEMDERHTLFYHMGMGHYSASGNFSSAESVRYETYGYHTSLQLQHSIGEWSGMHALNYLSTSTEALVGNSYRMINGITDNEKFSYKGSFILKGSDFMHHLRLEGLYAKTTATEVRQEAQQQSIDGVFYTVIRTLRWIDGRHIINNYRGSITYDRLKIGANRPLDYQISIEAAPGHYRATHYPEVNYGSYEATSVQTNLSFQRFMQFGQIRFDPVAGIGLRKVIDSDLAVRPAPNYLAEIPVLDFRYISEDYISARLGLHFSARRLPWEGVRSVFAELDSYYTVFPNIQGRNHNYTIQLVLGLTF